MNNKQKQTYKKIFRDPISPDILWVDIESMLVSVGAEISEGNGSRIRVKLNNERAVFHRPHPEKETDKGAVKAVRRFLDNAGIKI